MRDRTEEILRLICLALAALIIFEILRAAYRANPFARLTLPPVPTLQTNSATHFVANTRDQRSNSSGGGKGTNTLTVSVQGATNILTGRTNGIAVSFETNGTANTNLTAAMTNVLIVANLGASAKTDTVAQKQLDTAGATSSSPLTKPVAGGSTNILAATNTSAVESNGKASTTYKAATASTRMMASTNKIVAGSTNQLTATNQVWAASTNVGTTNISNLANPNSMPPGRHGGGMAFAGGMPGMPGTGAVALPKEIQARVDKIVDSEIFGPVIRPLPMQLFGIAGDTALLRTDSGQSGLVKAGDSLGDIKLVRIGINRVLVEQNGNLKELMIFEGYGGESLMPKTNTISQ